MGDEEEGDSAPTLTSEEPEKTEKNVTETESEPVIEKTISEGNDPEKDGTQTVVKDKTKKSKRDETILVYKICSKKLLIDILLKATGNAPIMKKKKWAVSHEQHIGWISEFIKKYLKLDPNERLFLYINQTFAPAPDQTVKNLYECYGTDGKLIIHYCKSQAWG